jgi:hypothetical protein
MLAWTGSARSADENEQSSPETAIMTSLMEPIAEDLGRYYGSGRVQSLSLAPFEGTLRSLTREDLDRLWQEQIKNQGLTVLDKAGTTVQARVTSVETGGQLFVMLKCTIVDARGDDVCSFRRRVAVSE